MKNENIVVVPSEHCELQRFTNSWYNDDTGLYLQHLLNNAIFMNRAEAETNPNFKQLIPYCVLVQDNKIYSYQRTKKGGESRLHHLYSIGCGGHISSIDGMNASDAYHIGLDRELNEEVGLNSGDYYDIWCGFIYDDSNDVGKVHLGIVHKVVIKPTIKVEITESALSNGMFETWETIEKNQDMFENWSKIVIQNKGLITC